MPFLQNDSSFTISAGNFNNHVTFYNNAYQSLSNSQIPIDGNQSDADAPKFSRIIGKVGPAVGPTLDEISHPPKTDDIDQLPKTDYHLARQRSKTDDPLSTEAAWPQLVRKRDGSAMFIQRVGSTTLKGMTVNQRTYSFMKSAAI